MGRSVASVAAGFLLVLAGLMTVWTVTWFLNPDALPGPPDDEAVARAEATALPYLILSAVPCGFLGGFVTAALARGRAVLHGLALALLVLIALSLTTFVAQADFVPRWYQLALPGAGAASALAGGVARALLIRQRRTLS